MINKEFSIAVAGKGGTGKTTFSALLIRHLIQSNKGPVLVVDADPNSNLNEALGLEYEETIADIREDTLDRVKFNLPEGMTTERYMEYRLQMALVESKDIDMVVMGRPEGPGCYCYANHLLRRYLDMLNVNYPYVIMDNEAGMEHISRRTTRDIDLLFIVSDHSLAGVRAAGRVVETARNLDSRINKIYLVMNRVDNRISPKLEEEIENTGLEFIGTIPPDEAISEYELEGKPLTSLPDDSRAVMAVEEMAKKIGV
jgi:CO dehydrogenase maturation factor